MRYLTGVVILIAASMACSRGQDRTIVASPTSPTAAVSGDLTTKYIGGVSGPMDVLFPSRTDSFLFYNDLQAKYQTGLNRAATTTFVDREGEVVWVQEYIRYRVNGCDHATAVSRVMTQIDGGPAGGICSAPPDGLVIFPSRADSLQFRRELETKYQQMGRPLVSTFVDMEGSVIWIQEYLRYRANGCDHATAESKVFSQVDGGPVPPVCVTPCSYVVNPGNVNVGDGASTQTFEIRPNPVACYYTVASDASWLTFPAEFQNGNGFTPGIPFSVTQNFGTTSRTGRITVTWSGGTAVLTVVQAGTPFQATINLVDPFRGPEITTSCWFRSTATPCNFSATANLPGNNYVYTWTATYSYGTQKMFTQTGSSPNFSFTDTCGAAGSAADGPSNDLNVTLTITDDRGNTITRISGETSPALSVRLFSC